MPLTPLSWSLSMRPVRRLAAVLALFAAPAFARADSPPPAIPAPPPALAKTAPETLDDLRAIQEQTKAVLKKVIPCTVGLRIGGAAGSGVIVGADGTVLTAGHVSGDANRDVRIFLPDGRTVRGKTLGAYRRIDSGMIKITDPGPWPFVELGVAADLRPGEWVIATGHPGGYQTGRSPVVRLGRVGLATENLVQTDCTLVGGDSGGPLFNMEGKLVGIHSRIADSIAQNIHVPVDTYRETWDRLVKAEVWGALRGANQVVGYLGIECERDTCKIIAVTAGSPAEKAGLKAGDIVLRFDEKDVKTWDELGDLIYGKKLGQDVIIDIRRGDKEMTLHAKIGQKGGR
jgi:serine protease Do